MTHEDLSLLYRLFFVAVAMVAIFSVMTACAPRPPERNLWREMIDNGEL